MKTARRIVMMGVAILGFTGCGPKAPEIGCAIWIAGPACLLMMSLSAMILHKLNDRELTMKASGALALSMALFATMGLSLGGYLLGGDEALSLASVALVLVGPSGMSLGLIAYTISDRVRWPFGGMVWPALVVYLWLPALVLIVSADVGLKIKPIAAQYFALLWWGLPGSYGGVPFILLIILGWRARKRLERERAGDVRAIEEVMS